MWRMIGKLAARLGGFGATMVATMAASLLSFPVVISVAGPELWGEIAVAQAIAAVLGVIVGWGWGVLGPATIAGLPLVDRGTYFAQSLVIRLILGVAAMPVLLAAAFIMFPLAPIVCFIAATAALTSVIGGGWFYVGEGKPWRLFALVTLPTVSGVVLGSALAALTSDALAFVLSQLGAAITAVVLAGSEILHRHTVRRNHLTAVHLWGAFRANSSGVVLTATSAVYVNVPLVVVSWIAPSFTASYAMADKLYKMARTATGIVSQVTQGYVPAGPDDQRGLRIRRALALAFATGLAAGSAYYLIVPFAAGALSLGQIDVSGPISFGLAVALSAVAITSVVGLSALVAVGRMRDVAVSTVIGAVVGSCAMIGLGSLLGGPGVALAVGLAEFVVLVYQLVALYFNQKRTLMKI